MEVTGIRRDKGMKLPPALSTAVLMALNLDSIKCINIEFVDGGLAMQSNWM